MSRNVYVGNLPYRITDEEVRDVFSKDGREVVSVNLIIDRETGRPRGFGFVEMGSEKLAEDAVTALDGFMLDGRPLKVNIARPREGGGGMGPGMGMGGPPRRPRPDDAAPSVYRTGGPPREGGGGYGGGGGGGYGGPPREGGGGGYGGPPREGGGGYGGPGGGGGYGDRPARPAGGGYGGPPSGGGGYGGGGGGGYGGGGGGGGGYGGGGPGGAPRGRSFGGGRRQTESAIDEERSRKTAEWERRKGARKKGRGEEDEGGGSARAG